MTGKDRIENRSTDSQSTARSGWDPDGLQRPGEHPVLAVQAKVGNAAVNAAIAAGARNAPLDLEFRAAMEGRLGTDLSDVRVRSDREADAVAAGLGPVEVAGVAPAGIVQRVDLPPQWAQRWLLPRLLMNKDAWREYTDDPGMAAVLRDDPKVVEACRDDPEYRRWRENPGYRPADAASHPATSAAAIPVAAGRPVAAAAPLGTGTSRPGRGRQTHPERSWENFVKDSAALSQEERARLNYEEGTPLPVQAAQERTPEPGPSLLARAQGAAASLFSTLTGSSAVNAALDAAPAELGERLAVAANERTMSYQEITAALNNADDPGRVAAAFMRSPLSRSSLLLNQMAATPEGRLLLTRLYQGVTDRATGPIGGLARGISPVPFEDATSAYMGEAARIMAARKAAVPIGRWAAAAADPAAVRTLPYQIQGFFTGTATPLDLQVTESGKLMVGVNTQLPGAYPDEWATLPQDMATRRVEFDPDEIVFVRRYDQGGRLEARPAISLLELDAEYTQDTTARIQSVTSLGTAAVGGLFSAGKTGMAKVLAHADQATLALSAASTLVKESRPWLAEQGFQPALDALDVLDSASQWYGLGRLAASAPQLLARAREGAQLMRQRRELLGDSLPREQQTALLAIEQRLAAIRVTTEAEVPTASNASMAGPLTPTENAPVIENAPAIQTAPFVENAPLMVVEPSRGSGGLPDRTMERGRAIAEEFAGRAATVESTLDELAPTPEKLAQYDVWVPPEGAAERPPVSAPPDARRQWLRDRFEIHLDQAVDRFASEGLTDRQLTALEEHPGLERAFRGSRIDGFLKESIMLDPDLAEVITAPDFFPEPDILDSILPDYFDAGTRRAWADHLARYRERYGTRAWLLDTEGGQRLRSAGSSGSPSAQGSGGLVAPAPPPTSGPPAAAAPVAKSAQVAKTAQVAKPARPAKSAQVAKTAPPMQAAPVKVRKSIGRDPDAVPVKTPPRPVKVPKTIGRAKRVPTQPKTPEAELASLRELAEQGLIQPPSSLTGQSADEAAAEVTELERLRRLARQMGRR